MCSRENSDTHFRESCAKSLGNISRPTEVASFRQWRWKVGRSSERNVSSVLFDIRKQMFGVCPTRPEYGAFHPRVKLEYESKRECSKQVRSPAARKTSNGVNDLSHMEITLPSRITPYSSGSRPVSIFRTSSISSFSSTTSSPTSSPGCPSSPDIDMYINIPSRCRTSSTQHASGVTVDQDMVADLYDNANRSCVNTPLIDIRGRTAARFSDTVHLRHCIRDTDIRTQRTTLKGRKQSSYPNTGRAREQFTLRLNDIVPAQYLRMCAFLGFSSSGRLLISYSREIKDVQSWEERYKYELQLWRFSEARPLRLLERIPLFGGEHVTMEKIFIPLDECDPVLTVYALEKGQCVVATQIVMDDMETQALVVTDICLNSLDEEWSLFTPGAIETIPRGLLVNTESAYYILHWALNHANEAPLPTHSCNGAHVKGHEYSETEVSPSNDLHSHTRNQSHIQVNAGSQVHKHTHPNVYTETPTKTIPQTNHSSPSHSSPLYSCRTYANAQMQPLANSLPRYISRHCRAFCNVSEGEEFGPMSRHETHYRTCRSVFVDVSENEITSTLASNHVNTHAHTPAPITHFPGLSTDTLMRTHYNDSRDGDRNSSAREWGWVRKVRFHKSLPNAEVASYRLDIEALLQKSLTVHTCQGWKTTTHCKHNHDQPNGISKRRQCSCVCRRVDDYVDAFTSHEEQKMSYRVGFSRSCAYWCDPLKPEIDMRARIGQERKDTETKHGSTHKCTHTHNTNTDSKTHEHFIFLRVTDYRTHTLYAGDGEITLMIKVLMKCNVRTFLNTECSRTHELACANTCFSDKQNHFATRCIYPQQHSHSHRAQGTEGGRVDIVRCRAILMIQIDPTNGTLLFVGVSEYTKIDPNHSSTMVDRWLHASVDDGIRDLNRKRNTTSKAYTTKGDQDVDDLVDMPVRAHTTHPSIRKQTVMDTNAQPFIHSLQETLAAVPLLYNRASRLVKPHQYLHNNNVCVLRKSLRVLDHPYWPVRIELVD